LLKNNNRQKNKVAEFNGQEIIVLFSPTHPNHDYISNDVLMTPVKISHA